jgi:hypothetical protein
MVIVEVTRRFGPSCIYKMHFLVATTLALFHPPMERQQVVFPRMDEMKLMSPQIKNAYFIYTRRPKSSIYTTEIYIL